MPPQQLPSSPRPPAATGRRPAFRVRQRQTARSTTRIGWPRTSITAPACRRSPGPATKAATATAAGAVSPAPRFHCRPRTEGRPRPFPNRPRHLDTLAPSPDGPPSVEAMRWRGRTHGRLQQVMPRESSDLATHAGRLLPDRPIRQSSWRWPVANPPPGWTGECLASSTGPDDPSWTAPCGPSPVRGGLPAQSCAKRKPIRAGRSCGPVRRLRRTASSGST